jgi:hypothetical protein
VPAGGGGAHLRVFRICCRRFALPWLTAFFAAAYQR